MNLPDKIVALHKALHIADLPHAFGGALALAWCTHRARGTIDIDINVFVDVDQCKAVFAALPERLAHTAKSRRTLREEGQVRLWWEKTPVDVFLNTTDFHLAAARRIRWETFMGESIPFLSCNDLAIFKAFFNRSQDWADLEAMHAAGTLNVEKVSAVLMNYLGGDDERLDKLRSLV
ncbi:MAG: hypothetical protein WD468_05450 [Pirellulales bacterium]